MEVLKPPPHCIDSEQAVLGGLMISAAAIDRIDWLREEHFYTAAHRLIFAAERKLIENGAAPDALLVGKELGVNLERAGGQAYISSLMMNTPSASNIHRYAQFIIDHYKLRQMIALGHEIAEKAAAPDANADDISAELESRLTDTDKPDDSEAVEFHKSMDDAYQSRNAKGGLSTGFIDLDRITTTLKGGDLIIIAGRPSMGKSALATCIGEHTATQLPVGMWSLEMSRAKVANRIMGWHERHGDVSKLTKLQLYIDTPHTLTAGSLRIRMKRLKRKYGISLAIVDYLQLMKGSGENRTQEIGSISRGLKRLAVEFDIPVIAVCQLNRGVEARADKRPLLSDLRESGDIEQDADVVMMVYRDEYYNDASPAAGTAEVIVRKNRDGDIGTCRLTFIHNHARFANYAGPEIRYEQPKPVRTGRITSVDFKTMASGE